MNFNILASHLFLALLLLILFSTELYAVQQIDMAELRASKGAIAEGNIDYIPDLPQAGEQITLIVTGIQQDGCTPEYVSHAMVESTITVEIMRPDSDLVVCGQTLTPWKIELEIEQLASGEYTVDVYSSEEHQGIPTDRTLHTSNTLSVSPSGAQELQHFIYLPNIISR